MQPSVRPDTSAVVATLLRCMKTYGHERLEFEFRLGHKTPHGFRPGVDRASWTRLKQALDAGRGWRRSHLQTTERIDGNGTKMIVRADGPPSVIHKKRLNDADFETGSPWCARMSLSLEEPDAAVPAVDTKYERRKERWSYAFKCWSVDLTRVAGNMPHQMDEDTESFEVEVELADTKELFVRTAEAVVAWGWDVVADMCALMDHDTATNGEATTVE